MQNKQIKTKQRVKQYAEVFTAEREVKAMCDLIPKEVWENIESTCLEPTCGTGNFLIEILKRKLKHCKNEKEGLKALNSLYGIDIQEYNVAETRLRLVELYKGHYPNANDFAMLVAMAITKNNIICDNMLNPQTEIVKSWGILADEKYIKTLERRKINVNHKIHR